MYLKFFVFALLVAIAFSTSCTSPNYHFNEASTHNRCAPGNNCQCDGMRTCSLWGWCQGSSRVSCTSPNYHYNEAITHNRCNKYSSTKNCQCDGARTCSHWGWCQGRSR